MSKKEKSSLEKKLLIEKKSSWEKWDDKKKKKVFDFCDGYKEFLNNAKTERESVKEGIKIARANGFISFDEIKKKNIKITQGAKVYFVNRDKNLALIKFGKDLLKDGANFIVSHVDSPHLDLKVNPLYEDESIAFLKTHYYGGIKKYHWPTIPLALHGVIITKDGKKQEINIGEKDDEPIFMITDLLPHLARKQLAKTLREGIEGEELNIVVGSIPVKDKKVKDKVNSDEEGRENALGQKVKIAILEHLNKKYGITEEDFFSAELQVTPVGKSRDLGFDKSLIAGFGQDDRVCAYTSLEAILNNKDTRKTQVCFWTDREEVGSDGVSGLQSMFLESLLLKLLDILGLESSLKNVYKIFEQSRSLSSDVTVGFDPDYKQVHDPRNVARLGLGLAIEKHTGGGGKYSSSEASAEYIHEIRSMLNKNKISWQTAGLGRVDEGGGGTIAKYLANRNVDTIDCGVALFNMHAPMEISSKADIYSSYEAYKVFFGS